MLTNEIRDHFYDLVIIGGGVNGCGIARDAAGRGLSVLLAEQNDLASGSSSASTKLLHGGLRYLENFKFRLVREALQESELLLSAMPHISYPMRFILPVDKSQRATWYLRLGLMVYDHLGRRRILPGTKALNPRQDSAGVPLKSKFSKAFEYSDCWIDDSRLVVLNARDAKKFGAEIKVRSKVVAAERIETQDLGNLWKIGLQTSNDIKQIVYAKVLINAAGPWVSDIIHNMLKLTTNKKVRLVRGSHIVVPKLFNHKRAYTLQGKDSRVVFAIPFEDDFTLIGTTDIDHQSGLENISCTSKEAEYLCRFVSEYFSSAVKKRDIVWKYAGVRSLFDDGNRSASDTTRDYVLSLNAENGAPILNIFGGKITTYRKLAESVLEKLKMVFPHMDKSWTAGASLPGGAFPLADVDSLIAEAKADYRFLSSRTIKRMFRCYGTDLWKILANAKSKSELGRDFGFDLSEAEVEWLQDKEFARSADDILWRRTKLGLRFDPKDKEELARWLSETNR